MLNKQSQTAGKEQSFNLGQGGGLATRYQGGGWEMKKQDVTNCYQGARTTGFLNCEATISFSVRGKG